MEDLWDGLIGSLRTKTQSGRTTSFWTQPGSPVPLVNLLDSSTGAGLQGDNEDPSLLLLTLTGTRATGTAVPSPFI